MPIEFTPNPFGPGGRKRRRPTSEFKIPNVFNPITGTHSTLREEGIHPYCAMVQVAAADTYEDYVICRGFDPRILKFVDYAAGDPDKLGISVAKPFGNRTTGNYTIGEIYPAFLPTQGSVGEVGGTQLGDYTPPSPTAVDWRVGQNAGTATPSGAGGHPTALVDAIEELIDHNGVHVQWMLISGGASMSSSASWFKAKENWTYDVAATQANHYVNCYPCDVGGANPDTGTTVKVWLPGGFVAAAPHLGTIGDPNVITNDTIAAVVSEDGGYVCVSSYMDDKIGTVKMRTGLVNSIPSGWGLMDGVANSVANGGSGLNMKGLFPRGATIDAAGLSGGFEEHVHQVNLYIPPHTLPDMALMLEHTHEINQIDNHTVADLDHEHEILPNTPSHSVTTGTGLTEVLPVSCTSGAEAFGGACDGTDWGPLVHNELVIQPALGGTEVSGHELGHAIDSGITEPAGNIPPYMELVFIERLDNSL